MYLRSISASETALWLKLRERLYAGLDRAFHEGEMAVILESEDADAFFCVSEDGEMGGPVGYIEGLYLLPEFRDRGHGRAIVDRAADWFRERGCREMATDAELRNTTAQEFFAHVGFAETFRIVEFRRSLVADAAGPVEHATEDGQ
jgi:aminoglycoside 6'-N-acetyltransferase I